MNANMAMLLILISSVFGAFSTLLFKMGSEFKMNLSNKKMMGAVFLAGFSFLFYLYALKHAPLTFIYLIASISYIWAVILAKTILKEKINKYKIAGVCLVCMGIIILQI